VRLHYVEQGQGEPLVLLHGNAGMIEDFASSGLIDRASRKYRVIVFDRPGFGHSDRPRGTIWTHEAQARLIHDALSNIGADVPSYSATPGERQSPPQWPTNILKWSLRLF
jgi:pimeloyl-ACP methyl ester carboxylesterase